jgi:hypothetical protein
MSLLLAIDMNTLDADHGGEHETGNDRRPLPDRRKRTRRCTAEMRDENLTAYAAEIVLILVLADWDAAIYWALVAGDIVMVWPH